MIASIELLTKKIGLSDAKYLMALLNSYNIATFELTENGIIISMKYFQEDRLQKFEEKLARMGTPHGHKFSIIKLNHQEIFIPTNQYREEYLQQHKRHYEGIFPGLLTGIFINPLLKSPIKEVPAEEILSEDSEDSYDLYKR